MDIINNFLKHYVREIDFYEQAAKICAEICESELEREGIRAIVTYRVKRFDRLKDKLIKRNAVKKYKSIEQIYSDIIDLAGVRIAAYFPNDISKIDRFIKSKFNVKQIKIFPQKDSGYVKTLSNGYKKIFSGYNATHYRVTLKPEKGDLDQAKYEQALIEIQVASVLMHAWAEVEHDLVYKPANGALSLDEHEILDELNGLVLAGELALRRLQKAVKERIKENDTPFSSHYELAAFLYDKICASSPSDSDDITMGRVDVLYKFLKEINLDRPKDMGKYIEDLHIEDNTLSVAEQIIDAIVETDPSLYKIFIKVKSQIANKNPYIDSNAQSDSEQSKKAILYFIDKWADLQFIMKRFIDKYKPDMEKGYQINVDAITSLLNDRDISAKLKNVNKINHEILHSNSVPSNEQLIEQGEKIQYVIDKVLTNFNPEELSEIEERINAIDIKPN